MKNRIKLVMVFAVVLGLMMGPALADYAMAEPQTKCPVMGLTIDDHVYTDYNGKRIFFCCADCLEKFKSDPSKYLGKMEAEKVDLAPTPAK